MKIRCPHCCNYSTVADSVIGSMTRCPVCCSSIEAVNPNLTPCPDCFEWISRRAASCPHCGVVLNKTAETAVHTFVKEVAEEVMLTGRPSLWGYSGMIVLGVITIPILMGIFILLAVWLEMHFTTFEITNRRVVVSRGIFNRYRSEIYISDMRDANFSQTFWQRLVHIGDISIGTAATAGTEIVLGKVAAPEKIIELLNSLRCHRGC